MTRTAIVLAAAALAGLSTPANAQEAALKSFNFGGTSHVDRLPNPLLTSFSTDVGSVTGLRVDRQALHVVAVTQPTRLALSTSAITGLPARVSWSQTHTALAGAFVVTLLMDAAQTRDLARRGWPGFREANPLLGDRPSVGQVNTYTAIAGLSVLGAAAALPPKVRPWLLGAAIAVQAFTVAGSVQNGLPIRFF
ncbi:MAG: hypothetical protein DMD41_16610 [Gemmatimonadetes bacterium]|nr:MAG: hypothetical protein DMD41_16610 [Gemmatimonadota bacterium]